MGLLEMLNKHHKDKKVTVLANEYVIFEHKLEQCLGRYRVFDFNGVELIIKATLDTPQEVMTVDNLSEKVKNLKIDNGAEVGVSDIRSCLGVCDMDNVRLAYGQGPDDYKWFMYVKDSIANGNYSTALGENTTTYGSWSFTAGQNTTTRGNWAFATGNKSIAAGAGSFAVGGSWAYGDYSVAMGWSTANADYSTAMGYNATANADHSTAIGYEASANGNYSIAMGNNAITKMEYSIAVGYNSNTNNIGSFAMGDGAITNGDYSTAIGTEATAYGKYSLALGSGGKSKGDYSTALGRETTAYGNYSTAIGYKTTTDASYSTATGTNITVIKDNTLGNGGSIYGEELYSKKFDGSGIVEGDLDKLSILYSTTNKNYYTISGEDPSGRYFDTNMIQGNTTVNITQLVYTLVGKAKDFKTQIDNQQATIQDLTSRLNALEST